MPRPPQYPRAKAMHEESIATESRVITLRFCILVLGKYVNIIEYFGLKVKTTVHGV